MSLENIIGMKHFFANLHKDVVSVKSDDFAAFDRYRSKPLRSAFNTASDLECTCSRS